MRKKKPESEQHLSFWTSLIQKAKVRIQERHYLFRLTVAVIALVLIPYAASMISMFRYSYREMNVTNERFYSQSLTDFSVLFSKQVNGYFMHAAQLSADSRNPNRAASELQSEKILGYPITYPRVIQILMQYNTVGYDYGVYYPNADALFTTSNKFTLSSYLRAMQLNTDEMNRFFTYDNVNNIHFCAVGSESEFKKLYVGIPTTLGNSREPAILFYIMTGSSINIDRISSNASSAQWAVIDTQTDQMIFCTGKRFADTAQLNHICTGTENPAKYTVDGYYYFSQIGNVMPFRFVEVMPLNDATSGLLQFYKTAWGFLIFNLLLFILLLILLLYISYHPVQVFLQKIAQGIHPSGEFETLNSMFEKMNRELSERNNLVLDFLLNNLLYGLPIPQKEAERFGIPTENGYFRVFVLNRAMLNTNKRSELTQLLREEHDITAFITDILGEAHTVLICLSDRPEVPHSLTVPIIKWMDAHFVDYELLPGKVMDSINRIHDSYLSCFPQPAPEPTESAEIPAAPTDAAIPEARPADNQQRVSQLKSDVEAYIRANFRDSMISQTVVADHFKISVYSLSRLFKNHIGIGFTEFITSIRLEEAQSLLLKTDMNIADIAAAVGMPNANYFSRLFKATYLVSPAQFRKNNDVAK